MDPLWTMMVASTAAPEPTNLKTKTKAKQRYLRRKKERRKLRGKHQHINKDTSNDSDGSEKYESSGADSGEEEIINTVPVQTAKPPTTNQTSSPSRPKKRRKISPEPKGIPIPPAGSSMPEKIGGEILSEANEITPSAPLRTPTPSLPVFPIPALPNAPSKSALALQGLDKALIDAELVDPDLVVPIPPGGVDDGGSKLSERMRRRLYELGITELFAVQTSLLPFLIPPANFRRQLHLSRNPPRDVCVSAPTGSGKTLAYVLPIVEILSSRIITHLRALIVLPTRDLVMQVRETFEVLGKGRGLKIGTATGQHSFAHEQASLINDQHSSLLGGSSKVDILICTPGRLMDHLNATPNFTLQHLRFLVIDEADRLLAQSFQDWLVQVLAAVRGTLPLNSNPSATELPLFPQPDLVAPHMLHRLPYPHIPTFLTEHPESSCQKLLFSATLTRDPGKIAALQLRTPKYFIVQKSKDDQRNGVLDVVMEKFSVPSTLQENMLVCESSLKPLMFFHLVFDHNVTDALIFTKSAESTTRLVCLFDFFQEWQKKQNQQSNIVIRAYSSDLPVAERKLILEQFKAQQINILICSDLISRGIDISHVSHVVSYDAPIDIRKYIHRVGRTARAGRAGIAWTLVEEQEARYFKNMLKEADHFDCIKRLRVSEKDVGTLIPGYEVALKQLKDVYTRIKT